MWLLSADRWLESWVKSMSAQPMITTAETLTVATRLRCGVVHRIGGLCVQLLMITIFRFLCQAIIRVGLLLLLSLASAQPDPADRLLWHDVRLDAEGKLLSWVDTDAPYDCIIQAAWTAFKSIPVQSNGYRTYITYPTFYGPNDLPHSLFSGRLWPIIPQACSRC